MRSEARREIEKLCLNDEDFCGCDDEELDITLQDNMLYKCLNCNKILKEQGD